MMKANFGIGVPYTLVPYLPRNIEIKPNMI